MTQSTVLKNSILILAFLQQRIKNQILYALVVMILDITFIIS